jgi:hypothetical protein
MAGATAKPRLVRIAELFERYGVEFIVLGGEAAVLHGSPLPTFDTDLCYRRTSENLKRLADALREIHPVLRGAPADLPFRLDAESLALGANFTFDTDLGPLDLLGWVEPIGSYEQLLPQAESISVGDLSLRVIALDDLIAIKRHIRRPKDQAALFQLEAIKQLREGPKK